MQPDRFSEFEITANANRKVDIPEWMWHNFFKEILTGGIYMADVLWKDRKRTFLGLPWSFTRYSLTNEKLLVDVGFLRRNEEEIRLYRILDITLRRSLGQRLLGIGTIHCCSADKSTPEFDIVNIKKPVKVKEMLSDLVEAEREKKRVSSREFMVGEDDDMDGMN